MIDFNLSIYNQKPSIEVSLDTFEEIALSRLRVLRWIEIQKLNKGKSLLNIDNIKNKNTTQLIDLLVENNLTDNTQYDNLSHFICRLAFSSSTEYSSWFISHEVTLFELKYKLSLSQNYNTYNMNQIELILFNNGRTPIPYFRFNTTIKSNLYEKYFPFHIFPFQHCPNRLIAQRLIYIRNGYCFIPHFLYIQVLCDKYTNYLRTKMKQTESVLHKMKQDSDVMYQLCKVTYLIKNMDKISFSFDTNYICKNNNALNILNHFTINKYINMFPMCMRYSYQALLRDGHLKNNARIQLTLFLKGIGLSLTECLIFFKKYFKKKQSNFDNHYAYFIRHQYGKEGASIDYTPFSCAKIVVKSDNKVSSDDYYGCPFKIFDKNSLKLFIKKYYHIDYKFNNRNKNEYHLKCKEFCGLLHGNKLKLIDMDIEDIYSSWSHPNKYFDVTYNLEHLNETEFKRKYHRKFVKKKGSNSSSPVAIEYCK